jgi:hypothetical protein
MRRIMLVIDDFNELVGLETLFRRLGFDVLSLGREIQVPEAILGFPPDLVIATGLGRHVDGLSLAPKLRYGANLQPKLAVLLPYTDPADEFGAPRDLSFAEVDAVIETPFDLLSALRIVAMLLNMEPEPLLQKYSKIVGARLFEPDELKIIKHAIAPTRILHVTAIEPAARPGTANVASPSSANSIPVFKREMSARESRYAKFLDDKAEEELPPMANADTMRDSIKKLAASEEDSIDAIQKAAKLTREKREFVRAMIAASKPDKDSTEDE